MFVTHNDVRPICRCDDGDPNELLHAIHLIEKAGQNALLCATTRVGARTGSR